MGTLPKEFQLCLANVGRQSSGLDEDTKHDHSLRIFRYSVDNRIGNIYHSQSTSVSVLIIPDYSYNVK